MKQLIVVLAVVAGVALLPVTGARAQQATPSASPSASPSAEESPAIQNSPPPLPSPKPAPDDPKIHKLAVQQFLAWQQGSVDRTLYSDDVNAQLSDQILDTAEKSLAAMGGLQRTVFRGISRAKGVDVFVYHMTCENASVDMDFALQPDGKIALIFFV